MWLVVCYYPTLFLIASHIQVLRYIYWQWVVAEVKAHPELQTLAEGGQGGGIFAEEEEYHVGGFLQGVMRIVPDSYLENLLWTQELLGSLADTLDSLYDLFSWKVRAL